MRHNPQWTPPLLFRPRVGRHRAIACPPLQPRYVIPFSHLLDPPYAWKTPHFPCPRPPRPWESESRMPGTGLIWGPPRPRCRCQRQ
jgi:hypothetical protein